MDNILQFPTQRRRAKRKNPLDAIPLDGTIAIIPPRTGERKEQLVASPIAGESMTGDGIHDGDTAVINKRFKPSDLQPGKLVAMHTPHGFLLGRYYVRPDGMIILQRSNKNFADHVFARDEVEIVGVVVYTMHYH